MESVIYQCGEITVDPVNRLFKRGQTQVDLEPKVFSVIVQLMARPNELLTRDHLLDAVWGHRYITPSTLNRAVAIARKAFLEESSGSPFI